MASDRNSKNRENYEKLMKPHQEIQDIKQDMEAISKTVQSVSDSLDSFKALQTSINSDIHKKIDDTAETLKATFKFQIRDAKSEFQEKLDEQAKVNGVTFKSINDKFDALLASQNQKIDAITTDYDKKIEKINNQYTKLSADTTKTAEDLKKLETEYKAEIKNLDNKYQKEIEKVTKDTDSRFETLENEINQINDDLEDLNIQIDILYQATNDLFDTLKNSLEVKTKETKDYFDTKILDYAKNSSVDIIKKSLEDKQSDLSIDLQKLKAEYDKKVSDLTTNFQNQILNGTSNLTTLQNSFTTLQQEYTNKVSDLDTKFATEITTIKTDISTINNELTSFKTSLVNIENKLTSEAKRIEESINSKLANYLKPDDLDNLKNTISNDIQNLKNDLTQLIEQNKLDVETVKSAQDLYVLKTEFEAKSSELTDKINTHIQTTEQNIQSLSKKIETTEKALHSLSNEVLHIKNTTLNEFTSKITGLESAITKFVSKDDLSKAESAIETHYKQYLETKAAVIESKISVIQNSLTSGTLNKEAFDKLTQEITDIKTSQTTELTKFLDSIKTKVDTQFKDSFEVFSKHISALSSHESKITKESIDVKFAVSSACSELLNNSFSKLSLYADSEDKQKLQEKINTLLSDFSKNYFKKIDTKVSDDLNLIKEADTDFFNAFNSHTSSSTEQKNDETSFETTITSFENNTLLALEGLKNVVETDAFKALELQINNEIEAFANSHKDLNESTTIYLKDVYNNILVIDTIENALHNTKIFDDQITSITKTLTKL